MRESRAASNGWGPVSIANTMVSRCPSTIGKRPANTTCDTFRSIPTDENGAIAKVEQSTPNLTSCGPCTSGVTRSSRMRSRCDLSENRACLPLRANATSVHAKHLASRFLPTADIEGTCREVREGSNKRLMHRSNWHVASSACEQGREDGEVES